MKRENKGHSSSFLLRAGLFLAGAALLCYPAFGNWWNTKTQSRAVAEYHAAVSLQKKDSGKFLSEAEEYNCALAKLGSAKAFDSEHSIEGYEKLLDAAGTGVMGIIQIERIGVELPIYHGTSAEALAAGAGHLEGSSLPVGGEGSHSVIAGHRGLPGDLLFTKLDQLEVGDLFTITVIDRLLTYKVDQIKIIEPDEYQELYIEDGRDYCTLMTCTPYGINSHRLLVRGKRTENAAGPSGKSSGGKFSMGILPAAVLSAIILAIISKKFLLHRNEN